MVTLLIALSTWLHALATIIMIGYYIFISLIFLPIFESQMQGTALRNLLELVSNRFRPYFGGSLLIFLVTGSYLMLINKSYMGLGHFFGNPWSALIVIKHLLVLVFLVLAVYSERAYLTKIGDENPTALKKFRLAVYVNTFMGTAILLLTSIAQAV
jgi:uncharacterized membrane protein